MTRAAPSPPLADQTTAMARALLRPVLRLLFHRGLSRRGLQDLCDEAYVEAAAQQLRQAGHAVTLKRVAEMSAVSLAKVGRLKDAVDMPARSPAAPIGEQAPLVDAATRVLTGWYSDTAFTDTAGRPLPLSPDGREFERLVARYGNGCASSTVAKLLLETESVRRIDPDLLEPQGRYVLAAPESAEIDHNALEAFVDLGRAIEVNQRKRFSHAGALQRTCVNDRMPERIVPLFRHMVREQSQSYLELIDDWLLQHESADESKVPDERLVRLGVGVYVIDDD